MEPTLHSLQLVLVNKWDNNYSAGDVVVFRKPGVDGVILKRVAAEAGDTIQIQEGIFYVNGIRKSWGVESIAYAGRAQAAFTVGKNCYFVLGDNVNHSIDSRFEEIGDVKRDEILGKVIIKQGGS